MKIEYDCIPCIYRQILEAGRMVTDDRQIIRKILNEFARMIPEIKADESAPLVVTRIQNYIKDITDESDPYAEFKEKNIKLALEHYKEVEEIVEKSSDPLRAALVMSAVGNSIDAGVSLEVDIKSNVKDAVSSGFKYSDNDKFKKNLKSADKVLIIADNAGEAVFDRLLIKELDDFNVEIIYAVRDQAILNDVTLKEAHQIGFGEHCQVISSGCDSPGMILDRASDEFLKLYQETDIIISKGQGNLEGLLGVDRPIFFLLKIKCNLIAERLGSQFKTGDFIFKLI
ncbi:MAG: damage-control phosphatase ARMT1 family protein [Halothermotrichaceae bacterium]